MFDWLKIWPDRRQILDLGCLNSPDLVLAISGAAIVTLLFLLLGSLGSLVGGRSRLTSADPLVGWGIACVLFVLAISVKQSLVVVALVLVALALIATRIQIKNSQYIPIEPKYLAVIALQFWILVAINMAGIAAWDDVSHWSPNTLFLWQYDTPPRFGMSSAYSQWPEYPYAFPFLGYLASMIAGQFIVQANAMLAWLMLAAFGYALANFALEDRFHGKKLRWQSWLGWTSFSILLCTLFNPAFNASFSVTGQSDTPTTVVVGFMALLLAQIHKTVKTQSLRNAFGQILQFSCLAAALVLLRQANLVILILLCSAFLLQAWRHGYFIKAIKIFVPFMALPVIAWILWRIYTNLHDLGQGFTLLPFSLWRWDLLPELLLSMASEMLEKFGLYVLLIGFSLYGLIAGWRKASTLNYLTFTTAVVFFGYLAFLLCAYIGSSFSEAEVGRAASFYRYTTHISALGIISLLLWMMENLRLGGLNAKRAVIVCIGLPILVFLIKPDWLIPQARPEFCADRNLAKFLVEKLPQSSGLATINPEGNSFQSYIIRYQMALSNLGEGNNLRLIESYTQFTEAPLAAFLPRVALDKRIQGIFIEKPSRGQMPESLRYYFGLPASPQRYFLLRSGNGWKPFEIPKELQQNAAKQ